LDKEINNCKYKNKCWRYSYSNYLLKIGYNTNNIPNRFILFSEGFATAQMVRTNKSGMFAELFPYQDSNGLHNLCPILDIGNKDQCQEYLKQSKKDNSHNHSNPQARKRAWLPFSLRQQVAAKCKYKCLSCGRSVHETKCHVDHIVPLARGGGDDINNLALLCEHCNLRKGSKIMI
jgi:predicted restriction endonuclease